MDARDKIIKLYERLIENIAGDSSLVVFLRQNDINKVAIYGYGALGRSLRTYLGSKGIHVEYIIDRNEDVRKRIMGVDSYGIQDTYPVVDAVIITSALECEQIQSFLVGRVEGYLFLLEDII